MYGFPNEKVKKEFSVQKYCNAENYLAMNNAIFKGLIIFLNALILFVKLSRYC